MDWQSASNLENTTYKIPSRWLFLHYYEALNILFRIENSLRMLVYVALKNEFKGKWADVTITSEEGEGTISSVASKRRTQAATFGYLGYPVTSPLMYLTTGELARLVTSDAYWKFFRPYFVGAKNIVAMKLDEIISVRNALAHFRPIQQDDVDTIKQSSKHAFKTVETALGEMLRCPNTVPTNTTDKWYTELRVLGTNHCKLRFAQSADEEWVRVDIVYTPPIIATRKIGDRFFSFSTLRLSAPAMLREYPVLAAVVTYATESTAFTRVDLSGNADFPKTVSLGFSRRSLETDQKSIQAEIEAILGKIDEETELIQQDNLARGKLVTSASTSVQIPEGRDWGFTENAALASGFKEDDPPEWWGELSVFAADFVSATHTFPWMPTAIAQMQFPF